MDLNQQIKSLRLARGLTQDAFAAALSVSAQAVSKWENEQACPDVSLLPVIADFFGVSIDALFSRSALAWDDDAYHIVVYKGKTLLSDRQVRDLCDPQEMVAVYLEGTPRDVFCALKVRCCDVGGGVNAQEVRCGDVGGDVNAEAVQCRDIGGDVNAQAVQCCNVGGDVNTREIPCGDVSGTRVTVYGEDKEGAEEGGDPPFPPRWWDRHF